MSSFTAANLDAYSFSSDNFSNMGFTCACRSAFVLSDDDDDDDDESMIQMLKNSNVMSKCLNIIYTSCIIFNCFS